MTEAPQALPGLAEALQADLLRYADLIEGELVAGKPRKVGDASDCASPVMRQAASLIAQQQRNLDAALADAERWKFVSERFIGADFRWGEDEECGQKGMSVLLIRWPDKASVWGSLELTVDTARAALAPGAAGSTTKDTK